jgi:hypothetical protein
MDLAVAGLILLHAHLAQIARTSQSTRLFGGLDNKRGCSRPANTPSGHAVVFTARPVGGEIQTGPVEPSLSRQDLYALRDHSVCLRSSSTWHISSRIISMKNGWCDHANIGNLAQKFLAKGEDQAERVVD